MQEGKVADDTQRSPMARKLQRGLPQHIFAVAARNAKNRFFIPSKTNVFAGICYEYVMIDNGCNSFLLPFREEALAHLGADHYQWRIVAQSQGTGAVKSPTLIITRAGGVSSLGSMSLAGSGPLLQLTRLRFHLGSESARRLSSHAKLTDNGRETLTNFLSQMGHRLSPERQHVLLGQAYLKEVLSLQLGGIFIMGDARTFPTLTDYNRVSELLEPLRDDFPEFDDLEDEDHDGDADEEYLHHEDIDEPGYEYMEENREETGDSTAWEVDCTNQQRNLAVSNIPIFITSNFLSYITFYFIDMQKDGNIQDPCLGDPSCNSGPLFLGVFLFIS